jgi:hypothetical protein
MVSCVMAELLFGALVTLGGAKLHQHFLLPLLVLVLSTRQRRRQN